MKKFWIVCIILIGLLSLSACDNENHEHEKSDWIIIKKSTCTKEGLKKIVCLICGEELDREIIEKDDHKFVDSKCKICNFEKPHIHTESNWKILVESTCTKEGMKEKNCIECNELLKTVTIDKKDHKFINGKCEMCNLENSHIHIESEWKIVEEPTCTKEGIEKIVCTYCNKTLKTITIDKIPHNYTEGICIVCNCEDPDYVEDFSKGLEFKLNSDNSSYSVIGIGTSTDTKLIIPNAYNGLPITSIGSSAFSGCNSLTSIKISKNVTNIGNMSFYSCTNLKEVIFGENSQLTSIDIGAFYDCTSLESIIIPNGVINIGSSAFLNCTNLKEVIFEENSQLTSIGSMSFSNCKSVENIKLSNSVISIGSSAFLNCTSLKNIEVNENNQYYKSIDGNLYSKDGKILIQYTIGKTSTSFEIPNSVTSIEDCAFYNCTSLTSIIIPDSVTSIGDSAFSDCISLTNIKIPDSVENMGDYIFKGCKSLKTIEIPSSVASIGSSAFSRCSSLTSITIPNSVESIGSSAFSYCSNLTNITIPDSVISIENWVFSDCTSLESIEIPSSVTSIGYSSFSGCSRLTNIEVYENNKNYKSIEGNLYSKDGKALIQYAIGKKDTSFVIPSTVTSIEDYAFSECSKITNIMIPNSITNIGLYAFYGCKGLTSIEIPNSVTSIGLNAFEYCTNLTIYCEVESKPSSWNENWNPDNRLVVWGYKEE